ncbi:SDR family oxidoreductase [Roseococcus suduntuyensis]|uniref:NAD(P)-dependent dehydrogenase (Short-subunit alcohol dehydrogenase family) n=1 Tax=Roseococcus suduntuyensis TaxID=455361 RepID=A0A840A837_9PROT|nr:SDR family oxidoreductase [Roseococcus suduntuyensis]MBB3897267.1 NAD(P)-dependent dehydrogenase (short-subunit alcohol dehydrogenase family) [Roseococcus suduntuyensis]
MSKVAVVTGASTGIGRASALALLKAGYRVALVARRQADLEETAQMAGSNAGNAMPVPTNVADPDSVAAVFTKLKAEWGRCDLLFNNAGMGVQGFLLEDLPVEKWQEVVNVNLNGSFYCAQQAFRMMKEQSPQGGRIINNGSISAHAPRPDSIAYTATKHAITGLTKSLALDGRKYNICAGQVDIGNAATNMTQRMTKGVKQPNGEMVVEPTMDVQNVANAIVYMDSLTLDANVLFMTIKATKMPFEGRG